MVVCIEDYLEPDVLESQKASGLHQEKDWIVNLFLWISKGIVAVENRFEKVYKDDRFAKFRKLIA